MEKKHGGVREKAGRNPVDDKKVPVTIYPKQSQLDALGKKTIQQISIEAVEKEIKKLPKTT